jgi:type IV pilus assembly protein PilW
MRPMTRSDRTQQGYSLIEVMVAISIALFLLGGTLAIVQHTRSSFTAQNQLAQLQDNERMAMSLITDVIQSAGYYPDPSKFSDAQTLVSPSFSVPGIPNIAAAPATPISSPLGDTITVRYAAAPQDNVFNCRGDRYTGANLFETWENTFSVVQLPAVQGVPQYQLQCTLWSKSTAAWVTTPLVSGVKQLTISYGLNTAGVGTGSCADKYKTSDKMLSADWSNICSVKITLAFPNPFKANASLTFTRVIAVMSAVGT